VSQLIPHQIVNSRRRRFESVHPVSCIVLIGGQVLGAALSHDLLYVVYVFLANLLIQQLLLRARVPFGLYAAAFSVVLWGFTMRVAMRCTANSDISAMLDCGRYARPGVAAACMATLGLCMLNTNIRKDALSRVLLRVGVDRNVLWALFSIPVLGETLVRAGRRTELLLNLAHAGNRSVSGWMRITCAKVAAGFVRTLSRNLYAREAEHSRFQLAVKRPVFLQNEKFRTIDALIMGLAVICVISGGVASSW
jgi:hypothetical protein